MPRRAHAIVAALFLILSSSARAEPADGGADADPAAAWIDHVRACQRGVFSIEARFTLDLEHRLDPAVERLEGVAKVRRGGRVRLELAAPKRGLLVSDGTTLVAYYPGEKVAYRSTSASTMVGRLFAFFLGEATSGDFTVRRLGGEGSPGEGRAAIELTPVREDPLVAAIVLTVEAVCPAVSRVLVVDHAGGVTRVGLERVRTNVGLGKALFEFTPPPGVKVIQP
jgi:outer membrane lipoprotein carrier protein